MDTNKEEVLVGKIKRILFKKDEFHLLIVETNTKETIVVKGNVLNPKIGLELEFHGVFEKYKGENQFKFSLAIAPMPTGQSGMLGYLRQIAGEKTAVEILTHFGDDEILTILDEEPSKLLEVKKIGRIKLQKIVDRHRTLLGDRETILFFKKFELTMVMINKIITAFKKDAVKKFKENPYILTQIKGIGFETADKIARRTGIEPMDARRVRAGIIFSLESALDRGHCYYPLNILSREAEELLMVTGEHIIDAMYISQIIKAMIEETIIFLLPIQSVDCVYLPYVLAVEKSVANLLAQRHGSQRAVSLNLDDEIVQLEKSIGVQYAKQQKEFLKLGITEQCLVLTGGPGTGKTTALKGLITLLEKVFPHDEIALCAPTGKASKRMSESTGREAKTIHRLLGTLHSGKFQYNEFNQHSAQIVIVDEVSMLDIFLINNLLKAFKPSTKFVFVGDTDQLPSVGAGAVLRDLIQSGVIATVCLTEIFRQAQDSGIITNAYAINQGKFPNVKSVKKDYILVSCEPDQIAGKIEEWVSTFLMTYSKEEIQVLTPIKNKKIGVSELNPMLQNVLNERIDENEYTVFHGAKESILFREHDKVMQMRNNYDLNIFNGDSGHIVRIDTFVDEDGDRQQRFLIDFDGEEVECVGNDLLDLNLAYAVTIHKSQGSEWPVVIIPISFDAFSLLKRNLLYTAITRAKVFCILIGDTKAIAKAVQTLDTELRYSNLDFFIKEAITEKKKP